MYVFHIVHIASVYLSIDGDSMSPMTSVEHEINGCWRNHGAGDDYSVYSISRLRCIAQP